MCFYNLKQYQKTIEYANKSHWVSPTIKAFYRQGLAHKAKKEYNMACECMKEAIKIARVLKKEKECLDLCNELTKLEKLD